MSLINVRDKTIQAKVVYYGTALSGKTTSLKHIHRVIDPENRVELVSLNTEGDRTFFFDFLPIPLGTVNGYQVRIQAFTVPGQVKYNLTRRYVLRGADAVIFVADSAPSAFDDNVHSMQSLVENLKANQLDPEKTPLLIQYNKRDVEGALPVERLRESLNTRGVPDLETIATSGGGVFEAFSTVCSQVAEQLAREYRVGDPGEARAAVERRLRATLLTWRGAAAKAAEDIATGKVAPPPPGTYPGLAAVDGGSVAAIIEVSSADVPDIPDAETLLQHAVDTNIESARLLSELTETKRRLADHVRQLAALCHTGVALSSELDVDKLLDRVLASALLTVGANHGGVLLFAENGATLRQKLVHGFAQDPLLVGGSVDSAVMDKILARRPFLLELDVANDATLRDEDPGCPMVALVAPVVHQGEVLGAITAYVLDRPLDQDLRQRLRFLHAVTSQATVALVNARLYARVESFNRELERMVGERTCELARALEDLQTLDRLKDDFLASMSHELLTPLQSIGSAGEILGSVAAEEGEKAVAERREFAGVVTRETARLTSMLRAVLDLSQLEAGKIAPHPSDVNLRDAVLASYQRLRPEFKAAQTRLKVRVEERLPAAVADAEWIGRVIDALLANAVKFGTAGSEVHVTVRRHGDDARVEVRDEGLGVPEPLRKSIFEKFKQLGDVLTEKPAGLGLGLPTARLMIDRMGGKIWHEPGTPSGSVFTFSLPLAVAAPA